MVIKACFLSANNSDTSFSKNATLSIASVSICRIGNTFSRKQYIDTTEFSADNPLSIKPPNASISLLICVEFFSFVPENNNPFTKAGVPFGALMFPASKYRSKRVVSFATSFIKNNFTSDVIS